MFTVRNRHLFLLDLVLLPLAAVLSFALMVSYKFWGGKSFIETPLPTLAVLFIMIGAMAILLGFVAEMIMRTYFEALDKKPYSIKKIVN